MPEPTQVRISRRLKALREDRGLTQEALAQAMGFRHRQTLASIEASERSIKAEELARAAKMLGVELEVLTDPFQLVGEGRFSFRAADVAAELLDDFEDQAGRWVATLRTLQAEAGVAASRLGRKLDLEEWSSFEDAHEAAEQIRQVWQLGKVPADTLRDAMERELGAQVLYVDAPAGLSGAAVNLPGLNTILVNRREPQGRRNFDLAHELFHLLTWDAMPPKRVEPREISGTKGNRVERLAENFAGALLMPAEVVLQRWQRRLPNDRVHDWLNVTATAMRVSAVALKWRMVVLGALSKAEAEAVQDARLANNGGLVHDTPPLAFSRSFIARVHRATEDGRLSLGKTLRILGMNVAAFADLCRAYGLSLSYEP